jgi:hypothetical protein
MAGKFDLAELRRPADGGHRLARVAINDEPRRVAGFVGAVEAGVGRPRFGDQQL